MNWSETRLATIDVRKFLLGVVLGIGATVTGEAVVPTVGPVAGSTIAVLGVLVLAVALCDCCFGLRNRAGCNGEESGCC